MMPFRRGDVILVNFPDSNLQTVKARPALVVQDDTLVTGLAQTVVALITSNMARLGPPSRVAVRKGDLLSVGTNLLADSVIVTDNLATVRTALVRRTLGRMPDMAIVDAALRATLAL